MSSICVIDTSIFCAILDVPNRRQDRTEIMETLESLVADGATLLLPLATIYETGNHIAQNGDGGERRNAANRFSEQVAQAVRGDNPFTPTDLSEEDELLRWLTQFPDYAVREVGFGDMSIIESFNKQCARHPSRRVFIWTKDTDLSGYDRAPTT
jgi:hypothetical protein